MHRRPALLLSLLIAVFLAMLGLAVVLPPILPLEGVTTPLEAPSPSRDSLRSGAMARYAESWFTEHIGLRRVWVALDRQLSFSLFREAPYASTGTRVVRLPGDWLVEHHYIRAAITPGDWDEARCATYAKRLRVMQDKLEARHIPFLYVIAPSKAELYPELIPEAYLAFRRPDKVTTNFERLRPHLLREGVRFLDGPALFSQWKREGVGELFARSGSHWSRVSVLRVLEEFRSRLNPGMRHPFPELSAELKLMRPQGDDRDLLHLLKLLWSRPYEHELPSPRMLPVAEKDPAKLPRLLWVHDSFGWQPIDLLTQASALRSSVSLYYFENAYEMPGKVLLPTKPSAIDWETYLKDFDAVLLLHTEIATDFQGWGLSEAIDRSLR